jgi:hypothetical protein
MERSIGYREQAIAKRELGLERYALEEAVSAGLAEVAMVEAVGESGLMSGAPELRF